MCLLCLLCLLCLVRLVCLACLLCLVCRLGHGVREKTCAIFRPYVAVLVQGIGAQPGPCAHIKTIAHQRPLSSHAGKRKSEQVQP